VRYIVWNYIGLNANVIFEFFEHKRNVYKTSRFCLFFSCYFCNRAFRWEVLTSVLHAIDIGIQSAGDYSAGMIVINRIYTSAVFTSAMNELREGGDLGDIGPRRNNRWVNILLFFILLLTEIINLIIQLFYV